MDLLYHYCPNDKAYNILQGKNIRMSDISKSNDSLELQLFFPQLHREIYRQYLDDPFPFRYKGTAGVEAFRNLVEFSEYHWGQLLDNGDFSNFVICFSEIKDCLSQWRGYADDGKGCCIGFSKDSIQTFCDSTNGVLRLEKVTYVDEMQIAERISPYAKAIIDCMRDLREFIVDNITHNDSDPDTEGLMAFNFDGMIESIFIQSLSLKSVHFKEEQEWRMFFSKRAYKNGDWIFDKKETLTGPKLFDETLSFLNNRIDFRYTNDDLIPFCPLAFVEFSQNPVSELWLGPKNFSRKCDVELFLRKHGYQNVEIFNSNITYR